MGRNTVFVNGTEPGKTVYSVKLAGTHGMALITGDRAQAEAKAGPLAEWVQIKPAKGKGFSWGHRRERWGLPLIVALALSCSVAHACPHRHAAKPAATHRFADLGLIDFPGSWSHARAANAIPKLAVIVMESFGPCPGPMTRAEVLRRTRIVLRLWTH